jgi:tRNA threonylcarbamoyladenosine modification (KEOPS) complex  Pcc1 subunit
LEAEIVIYYDDAETAKAVAEAISPDNLKAPPGLSIKTLRRENEVSTFIKCRKLPTFIATIDDLLSSISTAEKTLKTIKKTL